jgi:hypothetical protein
MKICKQLISNFTRAELWTPLLVFDVDGSIPEPDG